MSAQPPDANAWASRQVRNALGLAAWTAAWVASLAVAAIGPKTLWDDAPALTLSAIGLNVLVGIGMLLSYRRNLQGMDELQRGIQLQAMAWSLGAGLVGGMAWVVLTQHVLIGVEAEIAHLVGFMALVYLAGCIAGVLRYR